MSSYFKPYLEMLQVERGLAVNSISAYSNDLAHFANFFPQIEPAFLNLEDIRRYLAELSKQGYNNSSLLRKTSCIKSWYNFLVQDGVIDTSPAAGLTAVKRSRTLPSYLESEELERIFTYLSDNPSPINNRLLTILLMLYSSGMRISELLSLKRAQMQEMVDLKQNFLTVYGKGNQQRMVMFSDRAIASVKNYLQEISSESIWVFSSIKDPRSALTRQGIGQLLKKLADKLNFDRDKIFPHIFRHSLATKLLENGADIRFIQEVLGHKNINTTQIYTHLDAKKLRSDINNHPLNKMLEEEL